MQRTTYAANFTNSEQHICRFSLQEVRMSTQRKQCLHKMNVCKDQKAKAALKLIKTKVKKKTGQQIWRNNTYLQTNMSLLGPKSFHKELHFFLYISRHHNYFGLKENK